MIVAAALVPQAPLLLPGLTGAGTGHADAGAADPVAEVRRATADVVHQLVGSRLDEVVVLASGQDTRRVPVDDALGLHRWGVGAGTASRPASRLASSDPGRAEVPLPFAVGSALLDQAGWTGARTWQQVGWVDVGQPAVALGTALGVAGGPGRTGLLVVGDGSARRSVKAPGHLDDRAARFDDQVVGALAADPQRLVDVDAELASELMVSGLPAWQAFSGVLSPVGETVQVRWTGDPLGVLYVVGWADLGAAVT